MQKRVYIFILISFCACAFAQTQKDSIYSRDYQREIYTKNFLSHNLSAPANFGDVSLHYFQISGNRILAQQAHSKQEVNFYALGANQLGNFRISGDFLFNKVFEDSLAYGQRNDIDKWSTFNYYASKAGNYERQNYKANMTLSYKVSTLFQPFININYIDHWTTGAVDPRFESKKFEMKYNPGVLINVKGTSVGLKAIFGKGRENSSILYKNRNYSQSLLFPDRIHYLNLGYGFNSIKDTSSMRKYSSLLGLAGSIHTTWGSTILDIEASVERKNEDNTNDLKSTNVYKRRGLYEQDSYRMHTMLQRLGQRSHHLLLFDGEYISGKDGLINFSSSLDKVNYTVAYLEAKLGYLFTCTAGQRWNYDIGLDLAYYSIARKDYASFINVSNTFTQLMPNIKVHLQLAKGDFVQVGFKPMLTLNMSNVMDYSVNTLNNYIQGVVFWDYDYYRTNALDLNWNAKWTTVKLSSQYLVGIEANYSIASNLGDGAATMLSSFPANAKRSTFSIRLFLNL